MINRHELLMLLSCNMTLIILCAKTTKNEKNDADKKKKKNKKKQENGKIVGSDTLQRPSVGTLVGKEYD